MSHRPRARSAGRGASLRADSAGGLTSGFESGGGQEEVGLPLAPTADGRLRAALRTRA